MKNNNPPDISERNIEHESLNQNRLSNLKNKIQNVNNQYKKYYPAAFFILGFLFDVLTLSRIDDWLSLLQQATYLIIILQILKFRTLEAQNLWQNENITKKIWQYNDEILHFLLGSLLSIYTLFYFVSSSLTTSFTFLVIIFALLVANELPAIQQKGLVLKFALFAICLFSFLFIIIPITFGSIGLIPFLVALLVGLLMSAALYKKFIELNVHPEFLKNNILLPIGVVASSLAILYILKLLPPIPLSAQHMGIYHGVEKVRDPINGTTQFKLLYDRPFWKFWQKGAQDFLAEPGDKIICFVRVFAPSSFKDQVVFHWLKKYPNGWQTVDKITNTISGGRDEGFRGYAVKTNFEPGEWRVQLETTDGREIGRISFDVEISTTKNLVREFRNDIY